MKKKTSIFSGLAAVFAGLLASNAAEQPAKPMPEPDIAASVSSYILLDRTGSMNAIWSEALSSVNAYAEAFATPEEGEEDTLDTQLTLAVFDYQDGFQFDVLRSEIRPGEWTNVSESEVSPRGMTPLFDAINRTISLAETDNPEKAVIVIMTDGHENSSREVTREGARAALDRAEQRGWEVVFLGAEFASFGDADAVGVAGNKQMAVSSGTLSVTQERLAKKARNYGKGDASEIEFDAEDRAIAEEEDVKQRKGYNR